MRPGPRAAIAALAVLAAGTACAQAPASTGDPGWGVSASVLHRRLVERADNGSRLVEESGPMLRLAADGRLQLGAGALRVSGGVAGGDLDYDGRTQAGTPLRTESRHRDLGLGVAWRPWAAASWGEAWLVLHALEQRRRIASTAAATGLRETSRLLLAGARWSHTFAGAGWQWQPSVELRTSVHHRLDVNFGGLFDEADIRGGRRHEGVLALDVAAPGSPWSGGIAWTHARQQASPRATLTRGGAPVGTVHQPRTGIDDFAVQVRRAF